ncbi:BTAD domain-containing putative transcriptional regulator [Mycolicibacterium boenickei]
MAEEIQFGVLGPLEMSIGGTLVPLGTPKQRAVLAMLIMNRNRAVGVDSLISAVWDNNPPDGARPTIHSYVSNLRRLLAGAEKDPRGVLAAKPPGYRLLVDDPQADVARFTSHKVAGLQAAAAGNFEEASTQFSHAITEWRGPVLEDLRNFAFVDAYALTLNEDKLIVSIAHAESEIACGRAHSIIADLEALTTEHPYREPLWAQLITAYAVCERQYDALEAYQRMKATFNDDLGIDPGPTLQALQAQILRQEPLDTPHAARAHAEDTLVVQENRETQGQDVPSAVLRRQDGELIPLTTGSTRIGRSPGNDIVLSDPKVSRHHAAIVHTDLGFRIIDLRSANGIFVGDQRIGASSPLTHGDEIRIGESTFILELTAQSQPAE